MDAIRNLSNVKYYGLIKQNSKLNQTDANKENDSQNLVNELDSSAIMNKSLINFKGKNIKLNNGDLLFISGIVSAFSLSAVAANKLKNILSKFLNDNNFKSMTDMDSEKFLDEQTNLVGQLNQVAQLKGKEYMKLVDSVVERCYSESQQQTYDVNDIDNEDAKIYSVLQILVKNKGKLCQENDNKFIDSISTMLSLNKEQREKLQTIVNETLAEYGITSLKNFASIDCVEEQAALVGKISTEFNLSDSDETLVLSALIDRIYAEEECYNPKLSPFDRDVDQRVNDKIVLAEILKTYNLHPDDCQNLIKAMNIDAYNHHLNSIFDLLKNNQDITKYEETNAVLDSKNFRNIKNDLLCDIYASSKSYDAIVKKYDDKDNANSKRYTKAAALCYKLDSKINLTVSEMKSIMSYLKEKKYDLSDKNEMPKIAYELVELLNKSDSYNAFCSAIKEVSELSDEELDDYNFKYVQLEFDKMYKS